MGRGPRDEQAVITAQSLLFGPRISKQSPSGESEFVSREMAERKYFRTFSRAGQEVENGNFTPLLALENAQPGLELIEKQALTLLINQVFDCHKSLVRQNLDTCPGLADKLIKTTGDLDALLSVRDRAELLDLPEKVIYLSNWNISQYSALTAAVTAAEDLISRRDEIGPLPRVAEGGDRYNHLMSGTSTLCGHEMEGWSYPGAGESDESILMSVGSERMCPGCLDSKNEADLIQPDKWVDELRSCNLKQWSAHLSPVDKNLLLRARMSSEQIMSESDLQVKNTFNNHLGQHNNYNLF